MDISNQRSYQGSWYVNPNTRTLTSDRKNTSIKDRDAFSCMQHLLHPVEDMARVVRTPMRLAEKTCVNRMTNSVTIAAGTRITVNDGYVLTVTERGVECHHGENYDPYDTEAYVEAQALAGALGTLLRNAGGTQKTTAFSEEDYQTWTENVSSVLSYMGIDGSRDFSVNGMKYHKDSEGYWESEENSRAKAAWEIQRRNNRTYTFADDRTKSQVAYISGYYLEHASEEMRAAWQKALEETGVNPFPEGYASALSQFAMEQDFATGGNDVIFGADIERNIAAIQNILDRIDHPRKNVSEEDQVFLKEEKLFYRAILGYLTVSETTDKMETSGEKISYTSYASANYRIEPDNENECFTIFNGQGERLGVFFYSDIKCRQDTATGRQLLISENGTMWYEALALDQELKEDLQHIMGVDALKTEPLQGYTLKTHAGTGIQYVVRDGDEGRGGRVLLQSEADIQKYEALAETYFNRYPNLIESKEEAYIWASFEIRQMAVRTDQGILSIHCDGMSYNDNTNAVKNWSIPFGEDTCQMIFEWLEHGGNGEAELEKFSVWQDILKKINFNKDTTESALQTPYMKYAEIAFYSVGSRAPQEVKKAWMDAARETGANGLGIGANGMMTHISQMMVQRLKRNLTGRGSDADDILGNSVSSALQAAKEALYDLENPLSRNNENSLEVQYYRRRERAFYQAFIRNLEGLL